MVLAEHCATYADVPRDASLQKLESQPDIQSHERAGVSFFAQLCFCDDGDSLELVLKPTAEELLAAVSEAFEVHSEPFFLGALSDLSTCSKTHSVNGTEICCSIKLLSNPPSYEGRQYL